jgi:Polysaccharide pyruvyl transferase
MDAQTASSLAAGVMAERAESNRRVPMVVGVEPWSWQGDDNSGNMVHAAAARRIVSHYAEYKNPDEWSDAEIERLRAQHSHLVFVTANLIRLGVPGDHPSVKELIASQVPLAKNIEKAGLPVVVFGLGSQASLYGPYEFTVAPETFRLLKVLSDHSHKIAVRGPFTAEACVKLGIKNVEVIGCQSMFWHRSPQLSLDLFEGLADTPGKIAFNFSDARLEANLINQAMVSGYDVIGQGNGAEEDFKSQTGGTSTPAPVKFSWDVEAAFEKSLIDRRQYEHWIRDHFFQFRRPEPWLDHMRRYCFSYGTRLHGNMAAMIAGTRALWIVHDMRTKEVCDHFRLPWVELKEVRAEVELGALYDRADYSRCIQVYPDRYRTMFDYVERAGLPHSLPSPSGVADTACQSVPAGP